MARKRGEKTPASATKPSKSHEKMPKHARSREPQPSDPGIPRGWGEFLGVALLAIGGLMFGGLVSYQFGDGNLMGPVGRLVASALYAGFGMAAYLIVLGVVGIGVKALLGHRMELRLGEGVGFSAATLAGCVLLHVMFPSYRVHGYTAGGLSGELLGEVSIGLFEQAGTYLITLTVMCLGLIASTPLTFAHLITGGRAIVRGAVWTARYLWSGVVGIAQAQREYAEQSWAEAEAKQAEVEDTAEDAKQEEYEYEEEEEYEYEYEEEAEAEDDAEEVEETEEAEEPEQAEAPARSRRRSKRDKAKLQGKAARKNRKRARKQLVIDGPDEAEAGEDAEDAEDAEDELPEIDAGEDEAEPEAASSGSKPKPRPKLDDERPEICVTDDPELLAELGGAGDGDEAEADDDAGDDGDGEAGGNSRRKKAPLTPAELAARAQAKRAEAAAAASAAAANKAGARRDGAQPVQYLRDGYELPPLHLFAAVEKHKAEIDKDFIYEQANRIVESFAHFKIKGKVTKIHPGPVITRYEFKPEAGVKVSRIQNLENDLAMALEAVRIRILAPIPRQVDGRPGDPEQAARDRLPAGEPRRSGLLRGRLDAAAGARQGHRRQGRRHRPRQGPAPARRRRDGLGQVRRRQRDALLAALLVHPGGATADPDRPEDARV